PGRDGLAGGEVLAVTTGQQPGLFTCPLYTSYKGLSAVALARRLERDWKIPIVPVFWVAGDDHDFAEANHAWVLDRSGEPARIVLRERPPDAPLLPLWRERCGEEVAAALGRLGAETAESEFKARVLDWLAPGDRPQTRLRAAGAAVAHALLAPPRLVRETLPPETARALAELREALERHYGRLAGEATRLDATLERTVISARNAAVAGAQEIEKKLVASLKREHETLVRQVARARAAVYPRGEPQA